MSDYSYFGGIDLSKNHFSIHIVDWKGKVALHKSVTSSNSLTTIANMSPMRIGLEAWDGAHYWERTLNKLGHDDHIMVVKYVVPPRTKNNIKSVLEMLGQRYAGTTSPCNALQPLTP